MLLDLVFKTKTNHALPRFYKKEKVLSCFIYCVFLIVFKWPNLKTCTTLLSSLVENISDFVFSMTWNFIFAFLFSFAHISVHWIHPKVYVLKVLGDQKIHKTNQTSVLIHLGEKDYSTTAVSLHLWKILDFSVSEFKGNKHRQMTKRSKTKEWQRSKIHSIWSNCLWWVAWVTQWIQSFAP